jgi:hypothetical protein
MALSTLLLLSASAGGRRPEAREHDVVTEDGQEML